MNKTALIGFIDRFRAILDDLDTLCTNEDTEELNAQLEDCILLLEGADPDTADGLEEIQDAFEEIADLPTEYRELSGASDAILHAAESLEMAVQMARANM